MKLVFSWKCFWNFTELICLLFPGVPKERKPVDHKKKLPTDGRPLYLDAQATTPMVRF
jgi:hypothetical protein